MKVYLSNYRHHWISPYTILEKVFFWKKEIDYDDPLIDKLSDALNPICVGIQKVLDFIHPPIDYVKIDRWDTWSMDHTLANIILPMLKQLQETKHGAPRTDDEDVPEELRSTSAPPIEDIDMGHTDDNWFKRWDWILDEMIWAFEQNIDHDNDKAFFDYSVCNNKLPWDKDYIGPKYDVEGHRKHQDRMQNGFRLFGKYYQNLWD